MGIRYLDKQSNVPAATTTRSTSRIRYLDEDSGEIDEPQSQQPRQDLLDVGVRKFGRLFGIPESTPVPSFDQMASASPLLAAAAQTGRDVLTIPTHFANQLLYNYPRSIASTAGYDLPIETENRAAGVAARTAGVAGALASPINKLALLPKLKGATALLARSAEGAALGGFYAPNEDVLDLDQRRNQALLGAAVPPAITGLVKGAKGVSRLPQATMKSAGAMVNKLIGPWRGEIAYGKNPGAAITQEGLVGDSFEGLLTKTRARLRQLDSELDATLTSPTAQPKRLSVEPSIMQPLQRAMQEAAEQNNQALLTRLGSIRQSLVSVMRLGESTGPQGVPAIQASRLRNLQNMTPMEVVNLKRLVGKQRTWTNSPSEDKVVGRVLGTIYRRLDHAVDQAVDGTRQLNDRIANLLSAQKALERRADLERIGKIPGGSSADIMGSVMRKAAAAGVGAMFHGAIGAIGGALIEGAAERALQSPGAVTRLAQFMRKLSDLETKTLWRTYPALRPIIQRVFQKLPVTVQRSIT